MSWQRSKERQTHQKPSLLLSSSFASQIYNLAVSPGSKSCLPGGDWDNYDEARQSISKWKPLLSTSQMWSLVLAVGQTYSFPQEAFFQNPAVFLQLPYITYILGSPSPTEELAAENFAENLHRKCWQTICSLKGAAVIALCMQGGSELHQLSCLSTWDLCPVVADSWFPQCFSSPTPIVFSSIRHQNLSFKIDLDPFNLASL